MSGPDTAPLGGKENGLPTAPGRWRTAARQAYFWLAVALLGCVAYQVFLAGTAIFVDAGGWARHVNFIHIFEWAPILLLLLAFAGRVPHGRGLYLYPVLLFVLIGLQYAFANAGASAIAALHPVNALVIFWLSALLIQRARTLIAGKARV